MKKLAINLVKLGISACIIAALVWWAYHTNPKTFTRMVDQPKQWDRLALAWCFCMAGVSLTFVRWYLLVRTLGLPFQLSDAFRLGFLGYFFNFFSLGSVGGDIFKAVFIAREQTGRRAEAVATVVLDRVIGLYGLFIVSTIAILVTGLHHSELTQFRVISQFTFFFTAAGAVAIIMLLIPGFTTGTVSEFLSSLPKVGETIGRLIYAVRMYRRHLHMVVLALLMSVGVHSLLSVGIYFIATGLPGAAPSLAQHFVAVPLAVLCSALPLPVSGLGALEGALEFLYFKLPGVGVNVTAGTGLLVALTYRMITIAIALVGACYYIVARRELAVMMSSESAEPVKQPG